MFVFDPLQEAVPNHTLTIVSQWDQFSEGTPSAYYGTCISGFPNFFVMMGPNTITGHLSVIYTIECQINFTMRIIARIMKPPHARRSLFSTVSGGRRADSVMVTASAERADNDWVQAKARNLVWSTGCTSWFVDGKTGRNTQMYPDWQFLFWARSFLVPWRDFLYRPSLGASLRETQHAKLSGKALVAKTTLIAFLVAGVVAVIMVCTPPEHKLAFLKSF